MHIWVHIETLRTAHSVQCALSWARPVSLNVVYFSHVCLFFSVWLYVSLGHVSFLQFGQKHSLSGANDPCTVQGKRNRDEKPSSAGLNRSLYTQTEDVMLFFSVFLSPVNLLVHIQQTIFPEFTVLWPSDS